MRSCILPLAAVLIAAGCGRAPAAKPPPEPSSIVTPSGVAMVLIPAGSFVRGDPEGEDDERPARSIAVSSFLMDRHEVTQESFERLLGRNPSKFVGPRNPVERVSWHAAIRYANMRSRAENLTPCYDEQTLACDFGASGYRLPTEAEWEFACRAGTATAYSFGADARELGAHAWFKDNAGSATHPVGQKGPNAFGLHDMHGNVAEWCNDWYGERAYESAAGSDPRGPDSGEERVLRGGSWKSPADRCRAAARSSEPPGFADVCFGYEAYGFRCVRRPP